MARRLLITNTFLGKDGERYNGGNAASFEDDKYAEHIVACGFGIDVGLEGEDKLREETAKYVQGHILSNTAQPVGGSYADILPPMPPLTEEEQKAEDERKAREREESGEGEQEQQQQATNQRVVGSQSGEPHNRGRSVFGTDESKE